jgi:DNA helicase-2/ATP-dependent DNA helicase PcrA
MGHELVSVAPSFQREEQYDEFSDIPNFDIGQSVRSAQFGVGEVIDIDGMAVTVQFASGTTKKLNVEYARLEKI